MVILCTGCHRCISAGTSFFDILYGAELFKAGCCDREPDSVFSFVAARLVSLVRMPDHVAIQDVIWDRGTMDSVADVCVLG